MGKDLLPFLVMVIVQLGYAGMTIVSKVVMDAGMDPFVHTAYRQIFATISIAPFAYFFERKTRPKLTRSILFRIFLCSIFGVTLNQITFFVGLKNSTPTIACALSNLIPGITFLLAIPFGLEKVGLRSKAGQAKILGTIICVGGAMLLSFYHGPVVIGQSSIHWKYAKNTEKSSSSHGTSILGPFLLMANCVAYALWIILQAKVSEKYPAPYSSTTLMCFMASFQCAIIALCVVHDKPAWSLNPLRITAVLYNAIVCTALVFYLCSWCIERKGPLYVSVFNPLLLIIVAILSWALLREKLYVGTLVGSLLIVMGLYSVLWGKKKEQTSSSENQEETEKEKKKATFKSDLELQLHDQINSNTKGQSIK